MNQAERSCRESFWGVTYSVLSQDTVQLITHLFQKTTYHNLSFDRSMNGIARFHVVFDSAILKLLDKEDENGSR
jgi:hypothetical protein